VFEVILQSSYRRIMIVTHGNVIGIWLREVYRIIPYTFHLAYPDHIVAVRLNHKHKIESLQSAFLHHNLYASKALGKNS